MSNFLEKFSASLPSKSVQEKEAMLIILHNSILQDRNKNKCPPTPPKEDFGSLVKLEPHYLKDNDVFLASLHTEIERLNLSSKKFQLHTGDKNSTLTLSLNNDYVASSLHLKHLDELHVVKELLHKINTSLDKEDALDTCVISCLRSSSSSVRMHADDEPDIIDQFKPICNVSLGSTRKIEFIKKS